MKMHRVVQRALGVTAVATLALGMGLAAAGAAPVNGNIDPNATGSIIVHKHEYQTGTTPTQGDPDVATTLPKPIAGVQFTARLITDIDLSVPTAWDQLKTLAANPDCSVTGHTLGAAVVSPDTDAAGVATIPASRIGAYLVCETKSPANVADKAQPFIVTIPLPNKGGWLYNVNVYPKNGLMNVAKSVNQQTSLGLGSTASFPVTATVAQIATNAQYRYFQIVDTLDTRLTPSGVSSVTVDGQPLDPSFYQVTTVGQKVTVSFTTAGFTWLKANAAKNVVATFTGVVNSVGTGTINNTASLIADTKVAATPGAPETPAAGTTGLVSNRVTTSWGDLLINKRDSVTRTALAGAVFEVYAAATPYAANCTATAVAGPAISVNGATTFTTKPDGSITIPGLFVSDSVNASVNATQRCYVIKEVQAPAGFVLPAGNAAFSAVAVRTGVSAAADITVDNVQQQVPDLPLTGANGQLIAWVAGAAIVLVGGGFALIATTRARKRR